MSRLHFVWPGDPATATGGFAYDRRVVAGLRDRGWTVVDHVLPDGFPRPGPAARHKAEETLAQIPDDSLVVIDGLALGVLPEIAQAHGHRLRLVALVHHPLALETGLSVSQRHQLEASERAALDAASRIVTTSETTAGDLKAFGIARDRVAVVQPGTDAAPLATGSRSDALHLLCVATLTPRKGHAILVEALAGLTDRPWHLACVGSTQRDPATVRTIKDGIAAGGLAKRVSLAGEVSEPELAARYDRADLFVLPSLHEGFGMVLTEALARGLPIVATTAGAIPEALGSGTGVLVPPNNAAALRRALCDILDQPERLQTLRRHALTARAALPDWRHVSARFAETLETVERRR